MTNIIEEVKAAKQDLERKISQMINEFVATYDCGLNVDVRSYCADTISENPRYVYDCQIELKL